MKRIFQDRIFSGDYSRDMWRSVNTAETVEELRDALYFVYSRLQELEAKLNQYEEQTEYQKRVDERKNGALGDTPPLE